MPAFQVLETTILILRKWQSKLDAILLYMISLAWAYISPGLYDLGYWEHFTTWKFRKVEVGN